VTGAVVLLPDRKRGSLRKLDDFDDRQFMASTSPRCGPRADGVNLAEIIEIASDPALAYALLGRTHVEVSSKHRRARRDVLDSTIAKTD